MKANARGLGKDALRDDFLLMLIQISRFLQRIEMLSHQVLVCANSADGIKRSANNITEILGKTRREACAAAPFFFF